MILHPPPATDRETAILLEGVWRTYRRGPTAVHALRDVALRIPRGTFTVVVGRSGSGKSTLLHLLAAMDRPTRGRIVVGDDELTDMDRRASALYRRTRVGLVFQRFNLVPQLSALDNVALPMTLAGSSRERRHRRAAELLEQLGLRDRSTHRPDELSGGEQQRVAIARALVHDPPLLLADEPTGNLDSETGADIVSLLQPLPAAGRTVVVVSHNLAEFAAAADQVVRLEDGAIVPPGATGHLLRTA